MLLSLVKLSIGNCYFIFFYKIMFEWISGRDLRFLSFLYKDGQVYIMCKSIYWIQIIAPLFLFLPFLFWMLFPAYLCGGFYPSISISFVATAPTMCLLCMGTDHLFTCFLILLISMLLCSSIARSSSSGYGLLETFVADQLFQGSELASDDFMWTIHSLVPIMKVLAMDLLVLLAICLFRMPNFLVFGISLYSLPWVELCASFFGIITLFLATLGSWAQIVFMIECFNS